jgi:hypothetical protein
MELQPQQIDVEIEEIDPEVEREKKEERLQAFGRTLSKQRDEWVRDRYSYGVDKRWLEDEDQYNNKDNIAKAASQMMTSVEQGYPVTTQMAKPHRSTVFIGMTRQKTNAAEARVADILLPTDDRNWGITPTPNPYLMNMLKDERPATDAGPVGQQMGQQQGLPAPQGGMHHRHKAAWHRHSPPWHRRVFRHRHSRAWHLRLRPDSPLWPWVRRVRSRSPIKPVSRCA